MAGTINTANYNIKKYAANDTVSMLQTFNGNMDTIDAAIKARADAITVNSEAITKLESGLESANDGINSANKTISALQVSVTTNTRNIQSAQTELDSQDARITALEDGGSAIETVNMFDAVSFNSKISKLYKQGTHYWGNMFFTKSSNLTASDLITVNAADNVAVSSPFNIVKAFYLQGNFFRLNPNVAHAIGTSTAFAKTNDDVDVKVLDTIYLLYDGNNTYVGSLADTWKNSSFAYNFDYVL